MDFIKSGAKVKISETWQSMKDAQFPTQPPTQMHDPLLNQLIQEASLNNRDLAESLANIAKAKANKRLADAGFKPTLDLQTSASRNQHRVDAANAQIGANEAAHQVVGLFQWCTSCAREYCRYGSQSSSCPL